jgi:hypothetical protein
VSVLDRYGREIERPRVRMSLGFVRKELPEGEPETLNGVTPQSGNVEREHRDSGDGFREEIR